LLRGSRDVGAEVNTETEVYEYVSSPKCRTESFIDTNKSFENVEGFRYFGVTIKNKHCIHEEMKSRLNSGSACYRSFQNLLSTRLISKILRPKMEGVAGGWRTLHREELHQTFSG
jgi:hypothetical protein